MFQCNCKITAQLLIGYHVLHYNTRPNTKLPVVSDCLLRESLWPRPSAVIGGSAASWGLQQVSLHLRCYSLPAAGRCAADDAGDDDAAVSLQMQRSLLPSFPVCPVLCQSWSDWKHSGYSIISAVRLSCACTDDGPWHCMQNSMVWGLTCITLNLKIPPRIHWKLITIHGRCVASDQAS